jgi:phosphoribosylaminoimidazolecarboxamide formyltransferase/IMP cyclohydrolase
MHQLEKMRIKPIDMVVSNLYPFKETVLKGAQFDEVVENIDVGGPSMIRAAAKNFVSVAVVTNPDRYEPIMREMKESSGSIGEATLRSLMVEAYRTTAFYDAMISRYLAERFPGEQFPRTYTLGVVKAYDLRYGENPQQAAAFYTDPFSKGVSVGASEKLWGKEISFNNILDLESALELLREFPDRPTAVVIKHTNPCGIACSDALVDAFVMAYNVDPLAAFGCVIGLNRDVDQATAEQIGSHFVDCVIAPEYSADAIAILEKKKNIRLLRTGAPIIQDAEPELKMKKVKGGLLVQTADTKAMDPGMLRVVTKRAPTDEETRAMLFAWKVCKHVWSNSIILAKDERVVGIGAGQMSRVDSSHIAGYKAKDNARGSVMASDAFFPFRDGIDEAANVGVTAVIQPGGSIRRARHGDGLQRHTHLPPLRPSACFTIGPCDSPSRVTDEEIARSEDPVVPHSRAGRVHLRQERQTERDDRCVGRDIVLGPAMCLRVAAEGDVHLWQYHGARGVHGQCRLEGHGRGSGLLRPRLWTRRRQVQSDRNEAGPLAVGRRALHRRVPSSTRMPDETGR